MLERSSIVNSNMPASVICLEKSALVMDNEV